MSTIHIPPGVNSLEIRFVRGEEPDAMPIDKAEKKSAVSTRSKGMDSGTKFLLLGLLGCAIWFFLRYYSNF